MGGHECMRVFPGFPLLSLRAAMWDVGSYGVEIALHKIEDHFRQRRIFESQRVREEQIVRERHQEERDQCR